MPFLVLASVVLALALLFYQVTRPLFAPLFVAAVLAMLAYPFKERLTRWCRGYESAAAGLTTCGVLLLLVGPIVTAVSLAAVQMYQAADQIREKLSADNVRALLDKEQHPEYAWVLDQLDAYGLAEYETIRERIEQAVPTIQQAAYSVSVQFFSDLPGLTLGSFVFVLALYFFLVDGRRIIHAWDELTPLDLEHDRLMRDEFSKVCRGVVWATVVAAVGQGVVFGLGLTIVNFFAETHMGSWLFLLSLMTTIFAMVPVVGAGAVWMPTCLYLAIAGHWLAAVVFAIYCIVLVSTVDNVIKIVVIKDSANLHPLLVFVCVFGGIHLMGLLGVFVGPIVGAVLFSMMRILKRELLAISRGTEALAMDAP